MNCTINKIKYFTIIVALGFIISCGNKKTGITPKAEVKTEVEQKEEGNEEHGEGEVALTLEQYKAVQIETGTIEMRNLNSVVKANGYTSVPPQNSASVSALMGGVVQDIHVLEGTYVTKGKVLASIKNLDIIELKEDYKTSMASIEFLELEYQRQKTLTEENINTKKSFQEVKSKLNIERAKAQGAKSKLEALHVGTNSNGGTIPVIAPINGYVGKIYINKGAYAEVGKALFDIVDNSQMHLDLNVYEKDLFKIKEGQIVDVVLTNQHNTSIKAKIFGINKSFSNESKTVAVHSRILNNNLNGLIAGMYVSANINVMDAYVQAVPKEAVVKDGEKYFIYMEEGEEEREVEEEGERKANEEEPKKGKGIAFKPIEVVPGITDLGYTEILLMQQIPEGSKIVIKGAFYLLSASKGGGEHEH
jgi:membrane fusion protein, heavy metal efflux system